MKNQAVPVPEESLEKAESSLFGMALLMQALLIAVKEIRAIHFLIPLSTMSSRQLRKHFLEKAGQKIRAMSQEEFATFINEQFDATDFKEPEN